MIDSNSVVPTSAIPNAENNWGMLSAMARRLSPSLGSNMAMIMQEYMLKTARNMRSSI